MLHPGPHTGHFELKWVGPVKLQMCKITEEFLVVFTNSQKISFFFCEPTVGGKNAVVVVKIHLNQKRNYCLISFL